MENNNLKLNIRTGEIIFSVSEYIELLNIGLKKSRAKIIGEVGKVDFAASGHVYFSLRDEKDQSIINCIIWKSKYRLYGIELKEGLKIIASGCPEIYALTGRISFLSEVIEHAGEGELKKEYEKLKKKLTEEGLFAKERKRPIPAYPQKIGLITSRQGDALPDFLNNIGKFGFKIKMIDSRVEGQSAVEDLLLSLKTFRKHDIDVLVVIRGGGSFESLMAFNNETLAREVANFPVPVIVGVGHHKDEPLITFVADVSVSTPTAAANYLDQSWNEAILLLERYKGNVFGRYEKTIDDANVLIYQAVDNIREAENLIIGRYKKIENDLMISLQNFKNSLLNAKMGLKDSLNKSFSGFRALLSAVSQRMALSEKVICLNDPERQLRLGYSIARGEGKIIRSVKDAKIGQDINLRVADGIINSEVKKINKINKQ